MFKKFIIVLLLLVTPFAQAQAVVACAMMDAQTIVRCACPGEDHHSKESQRGTDDACCVVEVIAGERQFVAPAAQSTPLPAKAVWSEAPVVAILPTALFDATVAYGVSPSRQPSVFFDVLRTPLYLRTARLRL